MTTVSTIVTADSKKDGGIGHVRLEWPVTIRWNERSRSFGIGGHVGVEYANYKREKQRLEIENFSGRSPWVLLQDFHAKIFAQNLTAIFVRLAQWLADARYQHRRHGYRINFANALSKMKNNLVRLFLETSPLDLSWRLLQRMADAVVAVRPGRKFPRDMKKVRVPGFQMQYRRTR